MTVATVKGSSNAMLPKVGGWAHGASVPAANPPTITSFSPDTGSVGDTVTIIGTNFDGIVTVKFYFGHVATILSQTSTRLQVTVPSGASTGPISVLNNIGNVISATDWTKSTAVTGVAPDYSAYVTRQSVGIGHGADSFITEYPTTKIVRLDCQCATITNYNEAANPKTTYNWNGMDQAVKKCLDEEKEIVLGLFYNNHEYTGYSTTRGENGVPTKNGTRHNDAHGHTFEEWVAWWSVYFAKACVNRYSEHGTAKPTSGVLASKIGTTTTSGFKYSIKFYEIWNEANNRGFWMPNDVYDYSVYGMANPAKDYAELMAATYDAIKDIHADIYVGVGGTAGGRPETGNASGIKSYIWYQQVADHWEAMNYTKHSNGWADKCACDWIGHHAYCGNDRDGSNQQYKPLTGTWVARDVSWNGCFIDIPKCHNVFYQKGLGSVKIWSTESTNAWDPICVSGYGYRGDPPSSTYIQGDFDRQMLSPQEAYKNYVDVFNIWSGAVKWPNPGNNLGAWDILGGNDPVVGDDLPLGVHFYFAGGRDWSSSGDTPPYADPWHYGDHFGMYYHADNKGGIKKQLAGADNDPWEALAHFTYFPLP